MVLEEKVKLVQSPNAHTQYLIIPSALVRDSQYPFKDGGRVRIKVDVQNKTLIIMSESDAVEVPRKRLLKTRIQKDIKEAEELKKKIEKIKSE